MDTEVAPYVKLAKTPLAQQTSVCGIPAKPCSIVMAFFALIVIAGSHILFGALILGLKAAYIHDDSREDDSEEDKSLWYSNSQFDKDTRYQYAMHEDKRRNYAYNVAGGGAIASGIILVITGIIFLLGAIQVRPYLFYPWFISMMFAVTLGRIAPIVCSIVIENKYLVFLIIMLVVDIVAIIIMVFCWGQMAGLHRNKRYMKFDQSYIVKPGVKSETEKNLPPGSYPCQQDF